MILPNLETKAALARTLYYDATCALQAGDPAAAAAEYRRCLDLRKSMVDEKSAKYPQVDLMVALARCGEHAAAAKIADVLAVTPPTNENFYYQAACGYSIAAGCAGNDKAVAERYTSAAIASLRKAKEAGWNDPVTVETDPDLETIRADSRFPALIKEFREKTAKAQ